MTSSATNRNFTRNQLSTDYDFAKVFRFANSYIQANYSNDTGNEVELKVGTVMGRKHADGLVIPLVATADDGSQFPIGVCAEDVTVADGGTVNDLNIVNDGDIRESGLVLPDGTTLDSVIDNRRLRDRLVADTKGLRLVEVQENTKFNNY